MSFQRNPKDSMTSTWRRDRTKWKFPHWMLEIMGVHPNDLSKPTPVHAKSDPVPYISHWQGHQWILVHATWPLLVQQAYISYSGHNLNLAWAYGLYSLAYTLNGVHELRMLRTLGHKYGFLDGDKHERDQVPDHSVGTVVRGLIATATMRPLMSMFFAYRSDQGPTSITWWTPIEIGLYGLVLDGYYYVYHRSMHENDWLWQFHRTHHLTKHPNPLLTLYTDQAQELCDVVIIPFLTWATLHFVLQLPIGFYDWWYCHQYIVFTELFGHSGLRILSRPASTNTPFTQLFDAELMIEDHDLHHRQGWKKSVNYGKQTRVWDRLFGTTGKRLELLPEQIDWNNAVTIPWW